LSGRSVMAAMASVIVGVGDHRAGGDGDGRSLCWRQGWRSLVLVATRVVARRAGDKEVGARRAGDEGLGGHAGDECEHAESDGCSCWRRA
jgi:hypothetical protein